MMPPSTAVAVAPTAGSSRQLDSEQVLKAFKALATHLQGSKKTEKPGASGKRSLLEDEEDEGGPEEFIWLVVTAKQHMLDSNRLKPNKVKLPHTLNTSGKARICLIVREDTNKKLDSLVNNPSFPASLRSQVASIITFNLLRVKYKSYESLRQLYAEYDIFMADDRVYKLLPQVLGKIFYKSMAKRPIPVIVSGKPEGADNMPKEEDPAVARLRKKQPKPPTVARPEFLAAELEKALSSTMVCLGKSETTQIKVAKVGWKSEWVAENTKVLAETVVEKYVPGKWQGLRSIHIKGQHTAALPIWMAEQLWTDESKVIPENGDEEEEELEALEAEGDEEQPKKQKQIRLLQNPNGSLQPTKRSRKRKAGREEAGDTAAKKAKSTEDKKQSAARKERLKQLKALALTEAEQEELLAQPKPVELV